MNEYQGPLFYLSDLFLLSHSLLVL